jgi:hypothetical protein
MNPGAKPFKSAVLTAVGWIFFGSAGLAFWFGGRAIHAMAGTERLLACDRGAGARRCLPAMGALSKHFAELIKELEPDD